MVTERLLKKGRWLLERYKHLARTYREEKERFETLRDEYDDAVEAQRIIQDVAEQVQKEVHEKIAETVTRCLYAVFGRMFKFEIVFAKKRGKTEAKLVFTKKGETFDPMDGTGGGVVDVASFALRLACLHFTKPAKRRLVFLDEPFRFLSGRNDYRERAKELLETLSRETNTQFVMITHDKVFEIGKVIEL